jgi:hypothetical protein
MRLALAAVLVLGLVVPADAAELVTVGDGNIDETAFAYEVRIDGVVARVTARQSLRASEADAEAVYSFALPSGAAVVGLTVTPAGGKAAVAAAVDAVAAIAAAPDRDTVAISPDLGLVRRLGALDDGGDVAYEARIFPIGRGAATTVEITWVAPLQYVDGRLTLRIPARGRSDRFAAATGTVSVAPPAGVKEVRDLNAGGALLAKKPGKKSWTFAVGEGEIALDVRPVLDRTVAAFSTARLDDETGAIALAVLRPRAADAPSRFDRVVLVVDRSTSAAGEADAREAMATLAGAIGGGVRDGASLQAVLFDRTTETVLGKLTAASAASRKQIGDAIRDATPHAGSELAGGLAAAVAMLADLEGESLVVVLTDGVLPSDVTADGLASVLGDSEHITVSAILLAPDALTLPDPRSGVIAELTRRTGGHTVAVRDGEAALRAGTIADEIGAAPDWQVGMLRSDGTELALTLPDSIPAGGGVISFGWYRGKAPRALELTTSDPTLAIAKKAIARAGALAMASGQEPLFAAGAVGTGGMDRAIAKRSRGIGVVDARTALVAVDPADELAVDRLALAARGGTFARIPPPPETTIDAVPEAHVEDVVEANRRGIMDTAQRIRADLLVPQLMPAAKHCVTESSDGSARKRGRVSLEIEIARGEVIAARTVSSTMPAALQACLRDAAYALSVPTYTLTDGPDTIHLIRYPMDFGSSRVAVGDGEGLEPIDIGIDVDDPLGDLVAE